ncbi:FAD-binding oxidoreductase [Asanoa sp. WMMD1127]|uniref:FAD-binding oxidoreductase n=1 Tax=Asanoa sp. WMMD1127 TaxID=3016107 RepID=UPI00241758D2|nr:FAD-binding oxidoreductase [Asanoa sp. WMMD1127]MDG4825410.1 FAD-binding oxidoreductase [Asanoa sp. WMMD1127]
MTDIIERSDLTELAAAVAGPVAAPGDEAYTAETATWNLAQHQDPAVAVGATSVADVRAAVRFAAAHGLPVAVVATGHGAFLPTDGAVLVNMRRMNDVRVDADARTATVGGGVEAQRVVAAAAEVGLAPLAGSSPNVGFVGYTLGGGLSPTLSRSYGYSADTVRSVEIVTADGEVRQVDAEHEPDLFWAVRGGKSNFGVVTALTVDLERIDRLYGGGLYFAAEHTRAVVDAFRRLTEVAPPELSTSLAFLRLPSLPFVPEPLRDRFSVNVRLAFLGAAEDGERLFADLRATAPPIVDTVTEMPYTSTAIIHADPVDPLPAYESSGLLREFPAEAGEALIHAAGPDVDLPALVVEVRQLGGALTREPPVPNAVGHRDAAFQFLTGASGPPGHTEELRAPVTAVLAALGPWTTGSALLNFIGAFDGKAEALHRAYTPETLARLSTVKRAYDPDNLFRVNVNVPPAP